MSAVYIGTSLIEEKQTSSSWDERTGWTTTRKWKGRHEEVVTTMQAFIAAGVVSARVTPQGDDGLFSELEVDFRAQLDSAGNPIGAPNDQVQTTWDLKPTIFSKDGWMSPEMIIETNKLDSLGAETKAEMLRRLRFLMDALLRGDSTVPEEYFLTASLPSAEFSGNVKAVSVANYLAFLSAMGVGMVLEKWAGFISALSRGATSYQVSSWVLSKHQVAPSAATVKTGDTNIGRFYTLAALLSEEPTITTIARITMPANGFWWKQPPTLMNQPNGTYIMEQEWWLVEDYELLYYNVPI